MNMENVRVAIVTGASRGIRAAIAQRLARVSKIEGAGGRVSDPVAVACMLDVAEAALGGIDVLVNNAGIMKLATIAEGRRHRRTK